MRTIAILLLGVCVTTIALGAALETRDGLQLSLNLPTALGPVQIDGRNVSKSVGGLFLLDPRTQQPVPQGAFTLTCRAAAEAKRIVLSGVVIASGNTETICELQIRIPVGEPGWLFWDNMTKARPIRPGEAYVQSVYPLACVTTADQRLGLAVAIAPEPIQAATISYDPEAQALIVSRPLAFTPLARPELRMKAPFRIEIYRLQPGWAFRSALDRYYRFHPERFDWRAKYAGLWEFATETEKLPNPQHYAYHEGGPPAAADKARGIYTFPYTCTGDLIIALPVEWGVPKTYEEMLERLERWARLPRVPHWERLTDYALETQRPHSGQYCLRLQCDSPEQSRQIRQILVLKQKHVDPVTITVWVRGENLKGPGDANCGLWLDLLMADGTYQFCKAAPAPLGTYDWRPLMITVGQDKPITDIRLYLLLRNGHTGVLYCDDVSVTTASAPHKNLCLSPGFEAAGPPPELQFLHDNVMYDEQNRMRYFADTWGGADVPPASPINWLRFTLLVNPAQKNPDGRLTAAEKDLQFIAQIFRDYPDCAGIYMDGTSAGTTVTYEYRREFFRFFRDPFMYQPNIFRPCAFGMASVVRYVDEYKRRFPGKLAFGNVWASNRMFYVCMALDVPGFESSRWYDLDYMDYYRAACYHKPGLLLNYFRLGQQLDTREGGERFFRYATAYGLFPSIGRFTDEAYEKFGDLQHLYVPIVKQLFRAGWEPITYARTDDPEIRIQRFGSRLPLYFTLLNPTDQPRVVELTIEAQALGLKMRPALLEISTNAAVPLATQGPTLRATVALGPQEVAVLVLMPSDRVGGWLRERAAEILQGAAYIYAQTPPTAVCADLARKIIALNRTKDIVAIAQGTGEILQELQRLAQAAEKLPADLKRVSYRRELAAAERLLTESLLADRAGRIGWQGRVVAPADETIEMQPAIEPSAAAQLVALDYAWGRLIEWREAALQNVKGDALRLTQPAPTQNAITAIAQIAFHDAAGQVRTLTRRGYAYFGAVCQLHTSYDLATQTLSLRLHNLDAKPRQFRLQLTPAAGLRLSREALELGLPSRGTATEDIRLQFQEELACGAYPVRIAVRSGEGLLLEEETVSVLHISPLEANDLALPTTGAQIAVDSAYYAYDAKPLNDGVVLPIGVPFNQAAWAAAETPDAHWVQITWPQPQTLGRVVIYWNIENDVTWTSQHVIVQAREGDEWRNIAEARPPAGEPVTTLRFPAVTTTALRLWQPKGAGPTQRPHIMWLREIAVYNR